MRRFAPLVVLLVAGCASSPRSDAQRADDVPLAAGTLRRYVSYAGYQSDAEYRGAQCTIYPEWVKIDNEHGQLWVPRTSISIVEIEPK